MPAQAFALTKIQPPRLRSTLIARPGLEQQLGEALASARLTLLSAPAGYGKTAALTRQLSRLPTSTMAAWVALDEDDDLGRVAACLVAALEPFDLPWRSSPEALTLALQDGSRASRMAFAAALLNALAATDLPRGLLLLDDAHRITDPAVFEFFDALIERLPPHWGVVMSSRADPPLALPKLRAQGDCVELRQGDLGFSLADVRSLMQLRQSNAPEASVRAVHERTVGIAGEHLSGDDMAAALSRALGEPVRYESIPFEVYRGLGFPGAEDLSNMFQFKHDFEADYCGSRPIAQSRQLHAGLQSFEQWLARHRSALPLG